MKKMRTLLTIAAIGCTAAATNSVQAGNYRPTNPRAALQTESTPLERSTDRVEAWRTTRSSSYTPTTGSSANQTAYGPQLAPGTKTACCYDSCYSSCYTVPVCSGSYCTPVVQCGSSCSPRPYFPASSIYSPVSYGTYPSYSYPSYAYPSYSYPSYSYPNYGVAGYNQPLGGYGYGYGYSPMPGVGVGGAGGIYGTPGYGMPVSPVMNAPIPTPYGNSMGAPLGGGLTTPGYYPSNYNAGFAPSATPVIPGVVSPALSTPVYTQPGIVSPVINGPFYP